MGLPRQRPRLDTRAGGRPASHALARGFMRKLNSERAKSSHRAAAAVAGGRDRLAPPQPRILENVFGVCAHAQHPVRDAEEAGAQVGEDGQRVGHGRGLHGQSMCIDAAGQAFVTPEGGHPAIPAEAVNAVPHRTPSDEDFALMREFFRDEEIADLTFSVAAIRAWNMLNASVQTQVPETPYTLG